MNDHLSTDLEAGAAAFDLPAGDLDRVIKRGRQRNHRRQQLTASVAAVALLAGTVAAVRVANQDSKTSVTSENTPAHLGDARIDWQRVADPSSGIAGWAWQSVAEIGGQTYALSTAPGQANPDAPPARVVWRTVDGVDWEQTTTPADFFATDLAASDGRLYAIGTGPATSTTAGGKGVPDVRVGWSDDGTSTWGQQSLPIDLAPIAAKSTAVSVTPFDVAAGPTGTVVVVGVSAALDVPHLLPAGETAPHGWAITDDGIDVLAHEARCPAGTSTERPKDPKGINDLRGTIGPTGGTDAARQYGTVCFGADGTARNIPPAEAFGVVAHHMWADLHVGGDLLRAVKGQPFVFRADPGQQTFERADIGGPGEVVAGNVVVAADDTGFTLVMARAETAVDGVAEQVVLRSADGRTWHEQPGVLAGMSGVLAMGAVDGHLAVVGSSAYGGAVYAELLPEGWRTTSLANLLGVPAGGKGGGGVWPSAAAIGPLGVVIGVGEVNEAGDRSTASILASRDGTTWSRTPVEPLAGSRINGIQRIVIRDDRAVVTVSVPKADGSFPSRQVAIVGTPR